jgi:hypothetical protein
MNFKNLVGFAIPLALTAIGCVETRDPSAYNHTVVTEPAPTSSRSAVRIYPDTSLETAPTASTVPADEWANAVSIRDLIAADGYLKGAARNVDIEVIRGTVILRGRVLSEYDRRELEARIAALSGISSVDNRLVVARK